MDTQNCIYFFVLGYKFLKRDKYIYFLLYVLIEVYLHDLKINRDKDDKNTLLHFHHNLYQVCYGILNHFHFL